MGSMTDLGDCHADPLYSVSRHLTFSGHSGPSSRTSFLPSILISSGEYRDKLGVAWEKEKRKSFDPRIWGKGQPK